jgi:hypothetical protein
LLAATASSARQRELLAMAVESATRSLDDWKVDLLARIYATVTHEDRIDEAALLIDAVRDLEGPHLRLLKLMKDGEHGSFSIFTSKQLVGRDPGLTTVIDALVSRLARAGFVTAVGVPRHSIDSMAAVAAFDIAPRWQLTPFGVQCADYLADRAAQLNTP